MHHSKPKCAYFCSEWCIVGYETDALRDLLNWSIIYCPSAGKSGRTPLTSHLKYTEAKTKWPPFVSRHQMCHCQHKPILSRQLLLIWTLSAADTWRNNNIIFTSKRHRDAVWRNNDVIIAPCIRCCSSWLSHLSLYWFHLWRGLTHGYKMSCRPAVPNWTEIRSKLGAL